MSNRAVYGMYAIPHDLNQFDIYERHNLASTDRRSKRSFRLSLDSVDKERMLYWIAIIVLLGLVLALAEAAYKSK